MLPAQIEGVKNTLQFGLGKNKKEKEPMKNVLRIPGMQKSACTSNILVAALLSPQHF